MTREEKVDWLCRLRSSISTYMPPQWVKLMEKALTLKDIQVLSAESCEDAISRNDMLDAIGHGTTYTSEELQKIIKALPPVNPTSNV